MFSSLHSQKGFRIISREINDCCGCSMFLKAPYDLRSYLQRSSWLGVWLLGVCLMLRMFDAYVWSNETLTLNGHHLLSPLPPLGGSEIRAG